MVRAGAAGHHHRAAGLWSVDPAEGRGFDEHADDTIAILDSLGIDALPVYGASGASPHILALAARHPDRVTAATIIVGAAPLDPGEAAQQIDINAEEQRLFDAGDLDEIWRITDELRTELLADPLDAFRGVMASSTPADRAILEEPAWQRGFVVGVTEALRQDVGGWYDEDIATLRPWEHRPCVGPCRRDLVARRRRPELPAVRGAAGRRASCPVPGSTSGPTAAT